MEKREMTCIVCPMGCHLTVVKDGEEITVSVKGRHDPIIVPRAVVVVEAMAALTILDAMLENMGSTVLQS